MTDHAGQNPDETPDKTPDKTHDQTVAGKPERSRRRTIGLASLALGAVLLWASSTLGWAEADAVDGFGREVGGTAKGSDWMPALTPIALVLLAAILAVLAVRGWSRRVIAVLIAALAVVTMLPALDLLTSSIDQRYLFEALKLPDRTDVQSVGKQPFGPIVAILGSALALAAAVLLFSADRARALDGRYQTPAARRAELEKRVFAQDKTVDDGPGDNVERTLWETLDSGEDPTDLEGGGPGRPPSDELGAEPPAEPNDEPRAAGREPEQG